MAADIKLEMKEMGASSWVDVSSSCTALKLSSRKGFGSLGDKCDLTKLSFSYIADSLEAAALFSSTARQVRLSKNGVYVFEGYTEGNAKVQITALPELAPISLSAYPYAHAFEDATAPQDLVMEDYKICDPTDTEHSLVHALVDAIYDNLPAAIRSAISSYANRVETDVSITSVLRFAMVEEGEPILDTLANLLHEYGLVYYTDGTTIKIVEPYSVDSARPVQKYDLSDFTTESSMSVSPYVETERTEVTVGRIMELTNQTVFQLYGFDDEGQKEVPSIDDRIDNGDEYPDDGDLECDYEIADIEDDRTKELIYATGLSYEYVARAEGGTPVALIVEKAELKGTAALFRFKNETGGYAYLNDLSVKAESVYIKDTSLVVKDNSASSEVNKINEVETSFILDSAGAEKYIKTYRAERKAEQNTYRWLSGKITAPEPNTLIQIGDIPVTMLVRYTETDIISGQVTIEAVLYEVIPIGCTSSIQRPSSGGSGVQYISLSLSGTSYTYASDGATLEPVNQDSIKATVTRFGTIDPPTWYVNGVKQESHDTSLNIPPSFMGEDRNFISVRAEVGTLFSEQYIYKIVNGANAPNVKIQYALGVSNQIAPAPSMWLWNGKFFVWNGRFVGSTEFWSDKKPQKKPGSPQKYEWIRWSMDDGKTWTEPQPVTGDDGAPAVGFSISASTETYLMTSRSYVLKKQVITFAVRRMNTDAEATWSLTTQDEHIMLSSITGDEVEVTIDVGATAASFSISCTLEGVGTESTTIKGVTSGEPKPEYLNVVKYPEELPSSIADGSPLMIGDYILYIDEAKNEIPKYWTGTAWADVTENTFNFSQIMDGVLDDALSQEGTIPSTSVLYAYIGKLASKAALIEQLYAINLIVGNVTEADPNVGFRFRVLAKDADGNPIVEAVYNGVVIFKMVPSTGRIFLGTPNEQANAPLSGFMYDPEDGVIKSANDKMVIGEDGKLVATSADISNANMTTVIIGGDSYFNGRFNCNVIKTDIQEENLIPIACTSSLTQAQSIHFAIAEHVYGYEKGLDNERFRVAVENAPEVKFVSLRYNYISNWLATEHQYYVTLEDAEYNSISLSQLGLPVVGSDSSITYWTSSGWGSSSQGGTYVNGLNISLVEGGDVLIVDVKRDPSTAEKENMKNGEIYADGATLKVHWTAEN